MTLGCVWWLRNFLLLFLLFSCDCVVPLSAPAAQKKTSTKQLLSFFVASRRGNESHPSAAAVLFLRLEVASLAVGDAPVRSLGISADSAAGILSEESFQTAAAATARTDRSDSP